MNIIDKILQYKFHRTTPVMYIMCTNSNLYLVY